MGLGRRLEYGGKLGCGRTSIRWEAKGRDVSSVGKKATSRESALQREKGKEVKAKAPWSMVKDIWGKAERTKGLGVKGTGEEKVIGGKVTPKAKEKEIWGEKAKEVGSE